MKSKFSVNFTQVTGKLRPLNGTNLGPNLHNRSIWNFTESFRALRFSTVRLHDVPLDNPGMRIVDCQHIFGNFHADAADPANYFFGPTDDYIRTIIEGGSQVVYRLGPSIEHSEPRKYYAFDPADHNKFAEICAGIVRHCNHGWANGFAWNIPYWEIWNEPDLRPQMWDKDFASYCKLYVTVAKRLRAEFPEIKIGGPAITWANPELVIQLAAACREADAPLDFFSYHTYTAEPENLIRPIGETRKILDEYGFTETELHLNEWHYLPCSWPELRGTPEERYHWGTSPEGSHGIDSAAFNTFVMTRWQDTCLTMSNYYATGLSNWGFISPYGDLRKTYYSLLAFGDLVADTPDRVATDDGGAADVALLGGIAPGGVKQLLVSCFKCKSGKLKIHLDGVPGNGNVELRRLDNTHNLAAETVAYSNGTLELAGVDSSAVLLFKWNS